jgi:hypothetical protein
VNAAWQQSRVAVLSPGGATKGNESGKRLISNLGIVCRKYFTPQLF